VARMGMDVDQVEQAGRRLKTQAGKIDALIKEINGVVTRLPSVWDGADAQRFVNDWWPKHRQALVAAQHEIDGLGQSALNNSSEQRQVSSASGSPGASGAAAGGVTTSATAAAVSHSNTTDPNGVTESLDKLLGAGGMANDLAKLGGKGFGGLTGHVISGAGAATSLTTLVEGFSNGDTLQISDGAIGLGGAALGHANPALGIAASAAQAYGSMTLPTSQADIDGVFSTGAHHMFGKGVDALTDSQRVALSGRYDGLWGAANMISDSMDSKAAAAGKFIGGLFGR
jgi:uncharacterized protein YukE